MNQFRSEIYFCPICKTDFWSQYSGHYNTCECGESAVDQTEYYTRIIGEAKILEDDSK